MRLNVSSSNEKNKKIKFLSKFFTFLFNFKFFLIIIFLSTAVNCKPVPNQQNNPLLLLVSFDGFRWDYLKTHNLSNFEYLKSVGSHADFVYNSFSTVTFPNHWSIVTGLHEESHGVVGNSMFDPVLNERFHINEKPTHNKIWFAQNNKTEPIWTLNQRLGNGRLSAAEWIGSDILFKNETIINVPYKQNENYTELIDKFIRLFTDTEQAINFGAIYFDQPGK